MIWRLNIKKIFQQEELRKGDKKMSNELNAYMQQNERQEQIMNIYAIRFNPLNFYRKEIHQDEDSEENQEFIQLAAENFRERAQTQPLEVYYDDSIEDGKSFTLISGEKRLRAALYNHKHGLGPDTVLVLIHPKPKDKTEELEWIMEANDQTVFSKETRKQAVENWYNILREKNPTWSYTKLSRAIKGKVGYTSDRQVRNVLAELGILSPAEQKKKEEQNKEPEIPIFVNGQQYENEEQEEETEGESEANEPTVTFGLEPDSEIQPVKQEGHSVLQQNVDRFEEQEIQEKHHEITEKEMNVNMLKGFIEEEVGLPEEQVKLTSKKGQIHLEFVANDLDEFKALLTMLRFEENPNIMDEKLLENLK